MKKERKYKDSIFSQSLLHFFFLTLESGSPSFVKYYETHIIIIIKNVVAIEFWTMNMHIK